VTVWCNCCPWTYFCRHVANFLDSKSWTITTNCWCKTQAPGKYTWRECYLMQQDGSISSQNKVKYCWQYLKLDHWNIFMLLSVLPKATCPDLSLLIPHHRFGLSVGIVIIYKTTNPFHNQILIMLQSYHRTWSTKRKNSWASHITLPTT
jgi:hypothetical protein